MKHASLSISNFSQLRAFNGNQYRRENDFIALVVDGFFPYIGNLVQNGVPLCIFDVSLMESITQRTDFELSFSILVPRSVLREQFEGEIEADELALVHEFEEGFDRTDFRAEFSPSPNLEGPQPPPRDNISKNFPTVSSSPPRARTNNDGEFHLTVCFLVLLKKRMLYRRNISFQL